MALFRIHHRQGSGMFVMCTTFESRRSELSQVSRVRTLQFLVFLGEKIERIWHVHGRLEGAGLQGDRSALSYNCCRTIRTVRILAITSQVQKQTICKANDLYSSSCHRETQTQRALQGTRDSCIVDTYGTQGEDAEHINASRCGD